MSMTAGTVLRGRVGLQPVVDAPRLRRLAHLSEEPGQRERGPRLVRIERRAAPWRSATAARGEPAASCAAARTLNTRRCAGSRCCTSWSSERARAAEEVAYASARTSRARVPQEAGGAARRRRGLGARGRRRRRTRRRRRRACPRLRARSTSGPLPRTSRRLARPDLERRLTAELLERALAQPDQRGQLGGGELLSPPPGDGLEPQPERLDVPGLLEQRRLQRPARPRGRRPRCPSPDRLGPRRAGPAPGAARLAPSTTRAGPPAPRGASPGRPASSSGGG